MPYIPSTTSSTPPPGIPPITTVPETSLTASSITSPGNQTESVS